MLVKSKKITVETLIENACRECNGVGKVKMIPYSTALKEFEVNCHHCLGEKVISGELLERKQAGRSLKTLLHESDLTIREAAKKFNQSFILWNDATHGKLSLEDIKAKIKLIENTCPNLERINL